MQFVSFSVALLGTHHHTYDKVAAYICIFLLFIILMVFSAIETLVCVCVVCVCACVCVVSKCINKGLGKQMPLHWLSPTILSMRNLQHSCSIPNSGFASGVPI